MRRDRDAARGYAMANRLDIFSYMIAQAHSGLLTVPVDGLQFFHSYNAKSIEPVSILPVIGAEPYPGFRADWHEVQAFDPTRMRVLRLGVLNGDNPDRLVDHVVAAAVKWMAATEKYSTPYRFAPRY